MVADTTRIFQALPGAFLLLSPALMIEAVSDEYLAATLTTRAQLLGQYVFAAFPDNPATPEARSVPQLHASLQRVLATGQPHQMARQHYDVPDRAHPGQFVERHWLPTNKPVLGPEGEVQHLIHHVVDVTAQVQAEAELHAAQAERRLLHEVLALLPVQVATYRGPDHVYEFVTPAYQRYFPRQTLVGLPLRQALPEAAANGIPALFDQVYRTGQPYYAPAQEMWFTTHGHPQQAFVSLALLPLRDAQGQVSGILDFSYDVTTQEQASRQVQALNEELAATNEELQASNEEYLLANTALATTQQQLQDLNQALEARVQERTQALLEHQHQLRRIIESLPAYVATMRGPDHRYGFVSAAYQQLVGGRAEVGRPAAEAVPEAEAQHLIPVLDQVYASGQAYAAAAVPVQLTQADGGFRQYYLDITYQPLLEVPGQPRELLAFAVDVTDQVLARQQVQQLHEELAAAGQQVAREREEFYQTLEQTSAPIAILRGPEHRFASFNQAYQRLFASRDLAGATVAEVFPEAVVQGFVAVLDGVYQGEPWVGYEVPVWLTQPDGSRHTAYYNFAYSPFRENGQTVGVSVFAYEVSELALARQQVQALNEELVAAARQVAREREEFYQILEQTTASVAIVRGPEHQFVFHNAAYQQLFPNHELTGKAVAEVLPETREQGFIALLDTVYQTGEPYFGYEMRLHVTPPVGPPQTAYYNFAYSAYRENGQTVGISIFAYDVTELVHARQQREAQQRRLYELFEQAPVAIAIFRGPRYVIEFANPAVCAIWGRTLAQAVGTPLFELLPEAAGQGFEELLDGVMATGEPFVARELPAVIERRGQRDTVYWNFVYQPLREGAGPITAVTVVATEVTDQVLARQQVQNLNEELAAINEELTATNEELQHTNTRLVHTNTDLDTFVYTASHDLKAPITNIESILLALHAHLPPEVQQEELVAHLLHLLGTTVERFRLTITQLTDLTKLQQTYAGPVEAVALAALVQEALLDMPPEAAAAQVTVAIDPDLVVYFALKNARSIVYNLLSNAFKYRDPARPSVVQVRAERLPQGVVLRVQDNGLGLDTTQQGRLFGLFQRLHTHVEGTGVGLYLVKRLVENGGATIAVESQPGQGSTFTVTFPA